MLHDKVLFLNDYLRSLVSKYSKHVYFGELSPFSVCEDCLPDKKFLFGRIIKCMVYICKFNYSDLDFIAAQELQAKRELFLFKLFEHSTPVDLSHRAFKVRKKFAFAKAREIL